MKARTPFMLIAGATMVLGQFMTAMSIISGIVFVACKTDDMCGDGEYCAAETRCFYCGGEVPLPIQNQPGDSGGTLNWARDPDFRGFNLTAVREVCALPIRPATGLSSSGLELAFSPELVAAWCRRCVSPIDGTVDDHNSLKLTKDNIGAMGKLDWLALLFCVVIFSLTIVKELKDVALCKHAIVNAGERLSPVVRFTMQCLNVVRRWAFLPALVTAIPMLVAVKGGGACADTCF